MVRQQRRRAIQLFGKHQPHQHVRQRQRAQRPLFVGAGDDFGRAVLAYTVRAPSSCSRRTCCQKTGDGVLTPEMVRPAGFEAAATGLEARCFILLSYGHGER